jgi:hypothetical protein
MASVYREARRSCHQLWTNHTRPQVRFDNRTAQGESDRHGGCGIRAIEPAGTFNSTKQLRRYLEELLSNATPSSQ